MTEGGPPAVEPLPPVQALLDFTGSTVIVTGASGGIGRGIALRFAEAGARIAVHYRAAAESARAVVRAIEEQGGAAFAIEGDLAERKSAERVVEATEAHFGRLDVLINNAGSFPFSTLIEMTDVDWHAVLGANLTSVFLMTQLAAKRMIARGRGGAIVNIASIEAVDPAPLHSHYNAAKGGVLMHTRAAALELGPHGIRVNAVAPGLILKEGLREAWPDGVRRYESTAPLGRLGLPSDVADACVFLASPAARWITGTTLTVDGGVTSTQSF